MTNINIGADSLQVAAAAIARIDRHLSGDDFKVALAALHRIRDQ